MKKVLIVCPTKREYRDLQAIAEALNYQLLFDEFCGDYFDNLFAKTDSHCTSKLDIIGLIEGLISRYDGVDLSGVTSAVGYPGMSVAAIASQRLGLPGPRITSVLLCEHKYYSRLAQQSFVPEATPSFQLLKPGDTDQGIENIEFPLFVKPVKACFSIDANRIAMREELQQTLRSYSLPKEFSEPFNELLKAYTDFEWDASYLIGESLLEGVQVSLEGYVFQSKVCVIGIIDAVMFPGTISFQRFVYPSRLSEDVQRRMALIAETFISGIGYDNALFNIELMYNPVDDSISIIEVNPKIASQFTDLFEKVDGTNTYSLLLQIAAGDEPVFSRGKGQFKIAASCVLRTFVNQRVLRVPSPKEVENLVVRFPDTCVEICVAQGKLLSDRMQDVKSYRYGLINIGADSEEELLAKFEDCQNMLDFQLAPISSSDGEISCL